MGIVSSDETKFVKLKNFNLVMGILHLFQGALMLWLAPPGKGQIWTTFLDMQGNQIVSVQDVIASVPLGPLVASFLFVSAIAHLSLATYAYEWYVANLRRGVNYARWFEYAISSSIMIVLIAMLVGIFELASLILIFALNATMNLFGLMMELHNQTTEKTDWTAYIMGCFAGFVPWVVLGIYFFGAILQDPESVPLFVYAIYFMLAAFFNVFAINMVLQYRGKGRWADYLYGEKVYIILSLTAKSTLAWLVFGGTYRF
ncbi:MAG TPA: heliorhodopsin HeR [Thermoplasmata archaeon]|nr:heliorhodopsin HeR [Thermoplasmata archaeon]